MSGQGPHAVFVYGTLMPGQSRWSQLEPYAVGHGESDSVRGVLLDTGCGYPALTDLGADSLTHGIVVDLDPLLFAQALQAMDAIEGTASGLYRRVKVTTLAGRTVWTYEFLHGQSGMTTLEGRWPATSTLRTTPDVR